MRFDSDLTAQKHILLMVNPQTIETVMGAYRDKYSYQTNLLTNSCVDLLDFEEF